MDDKGKQKNVINEIKTTERGFVEDMAVLDKSLSELLQVKSLSQEDKLLFGEFQQAIRGLYKEGLPPSSVILSAFVANKNADTDVALLQAGFKNAHSFFQASLIASDLLDGVRVRVEELSKDNKEVKAILPAINTATKNLGLGGYIIKPVQRITKYPLLLQELVKVNPEPGLATTLQLIKNNVDQINNSKINQPNRHVVVRLLSKEANKTIAGLINNLQTIKPTQTELIAAIKKIDDDRNLGIVEKLSQIKWLMRDKKYESHLPKQIRQGFESSYNQLKESFSRQAIDSKALDKEYKKFADEIAKVSKDDHAAQIKKYQALINLLEQEKIIKQQSLKANNKDIVAFQEVVDEKIAAYTRLLQEKKTQLQKSKPLPAAPRKAPVLKAPVRPLIKPPAQSAQQRPLPSIPPRPTRVGTLFQPKAPTKPAAITKPPIPPRPPRKS